MNVVPFAANIAVARSYLSAATKLAERTQAVSMVSLAQVILQKPPRAARVYIFVCRRARLCLYLSLSPISSFFTLSPHFCLSPCARARGRFAEMIFKYLNCAPESFAELMLRGSPGSGERARALCWSWELGVFYATVPRCQRDFRRAKWLIVGGKWWFT